LYAKGRFDIGAVFRAKDVWKLNHVPTPKGAPMSHTGKKDKGQKEEKKKSKHTLKEKRKLKQEKHQQTEKKHIVIPGG
jgi:hypothetical protein